jgi:hypothetical protein
MANSAARASSLLKQHDVIYIAAPILVRLATLNQIVDTRYEVRYSIDDIKIKSLSFNLYYLIFSHLIVLKLRLLSKINEVKYLTKVRWLQRDAFNHVMLLVQLENPSSRKVH